ncbi:MAG: diguanylate cyclase [Gemmatimonadetes bacterium]|nr:diguanylate cyclase [Gemmatimonadota bacterium]
MGAFDYGSGTEIRVYPLYFLPISLLAWHAGRAGGAVAAVLCAASWLLSNSLAGMEFSSRTILVVNVAVTGASFLFVGLLIAKLRSVLAHTRALSRTDPLTLLRNSRAFFEDSAPLLALCLRTGRPLTVAYLDLDNFKTVNDARGHQAGDALLKDVAAAIRDALRPSDLCARLGGDEFAVLLPELGERDVELRCTSRKRPGAIASRAWLCTPQMKSMQADDGPTSSPQGGPASTFPGAGSLLSGDAMHRRSTMALGLLLACTVSAQAGSQQSRTSTGAPALKSGEVRLTYLGNAGWEITDGNKIILVDPFLTQFARWMPSAAESGPAPDAPYPADTALINAHVKRADYIVITHGHPDHALDAGYISRRTGAVIIGHETAANLARAYGVTDSSLITVIGGEDYEFGDFSLKVIPNIHSALDDKHYYNNTRGIVGNAPRGLRAPLRRQDYVEGGNLAYLLRIGGHEILIMGSMNFIEREMEGLRPDIALVGSNSQRLEIREFTGRLMRALGNPAIVIPTHADAYGNPNPSAAALADRKRFQEEVATASPGSRFITPKWFEPIVVPARMSSSPMSATQGTARQVVNPPGISPLVAAYSVAIRNGNRVFVSGMTGIKPGTQEIVAGGISAQTRQTLDNIKTSVEAAGVTMANVDECTVFLMDMADYAAMNAVYIQFFPVNPPVRAALAVSALPRPAARVEIKCSATIPGR